MGTKLEAMLPRALSRIRTATASRNAESPALAGLSRCAEEDSNLHPVIPDQALNLARLPIPPSARGLAEYSRGKPRRTAAGKGYSANSSASSGSGSSRYRSRSPGVTASAGTIEPAMITSPARSVSPNAARWVATCATTFAGPPVSS